MARRRFFIQLSVIFCFILVPHLAQADATQLISMLTSNLGVTDQQASGGAGSLLKFSKSQMPKADYKTVKKGLPGAKDLIGSAPKVESGNSLAGQASSLLGGSSGKSVAGLDTLTSSFDSLGLSPEMIQKFTPILMDYAKQYSSPGVSQILEGAFSLL